METTQYKTNIYFDITQKTSDYTLLFVKLHFMLLAWKLPTFENMKINTQWFRTEKEGWPVQRLLPWKNTKVGKFPEVVKSE